MDFQRTARGFSSGSLVILGWIFQEIFLEQFGPWIFSCIFFTVRTLRFTFKKQFKTQRLNREKKKSRKKSQATPRSPTDKFTEKFTPPKGKSTGKSTEGQSNKKCAEETDANALGGRPHPKPQGKPSKSVFSVILHAFFRVWIQFGIRSGYPQVCAFKVRFGMHSGIPMFKHLVVSARSRHTPDVCSWECTVGFEPAVLIWAVALLKGSHADFLPERISVWFFLHLLHFQFFQPLNGRTIETTRRGKHIVRFFGWPLCQSAVSEVNWALWSDSISSKYITTPLIFFDSASLPCSEGFQILMSTNRLEYVIVWRLLCSRLTWVSRDAFSKSENQHQAIAKVRIALQRLHSC